METPECIRLAYLPRPNETPDERRKRLTNRRAAKYRYFRNVKGVDAEEQREKSNQRQQRRRAHMDDMTKERIREQNRLRQQTRRQRLSTEERNRIREKQKIRQRVRREQLQAHERQEIRAKDRLRVRKRREKQQLKQKQTDAQATVEKDQEEAEESSSSSSSSSFSDAEADWPTESSTSIIPPPPTQVVRTHSSGNTNGLLLPSMTLLPLPPPPGLLNDLLCSTRYEAPGLPPVPMPFSHFLSAPVTLPTLQAPTSSVDRLPNLQQSLSLPQVALNAMPLSLSLPSLQPLQSSHVAQPPPPPSVVSSTLGGMMNPPPAPARALPRLPEFLNSRDIFEPSVSLSTSSFLSSSLPDASDHQETKEAEDQDEDPEAFLFKS